MDHNPGVIRIQAVPFLDGSVQQEATRERVDQSGDAPGGGMEQPYGLAAKTGSPFPTGAGQPVLQIGPRFSQAQRLHAAGGQDALAKLLHPWLADQGAKRVLTDQEHLQEGTGDLLQIRDHPQLFDRVIGQVLRLVDDDEGVVTGLHLPQEHRSKIQQDGRLARVAGLDPKSVRHQPEKILRAHLGAPDMGLCHLGGPRVREQIRDQQGLPGTGLSRHHDKAFALVKHVLHVGLRLREVGMPIAKLRIRTEAKRILRETVAFS